MRRSIFSLMPTDTFFFRDGKPFSLGESSTAAGIFPPFPSTVYGALRTAYISEHGIDAFRDEQDIVKKVIGTQRAESIAEATFRVNSVFVADNTNIYLPFPRDILKSKDKRVERFYQLVQVENNTAACSNVQTVEILCSVDQEKDVEYPEGTFFNEDECQRYLVTGGLPTSCLPPTKFLSMEPKIGIGRNTQTLTSEEGLLYQIDLRRLMSGYRLHVETTGIDFPNSHGMLKLGGENKPFAYDVTQVEPYLDSDEVRQQLCDRLEETRHNGRIRFKLYLATPAIWSEGWMSPKQMLQQDNAPCEILTAALGKYQSIGGWDIANRRPKTMYRAIPAGSVYYLQATSTDTTASQVLETFHYRNLSDERAEEGFGLMLVGTVTMEEA